MSEPKRDRVDPEQPLGDTLTLDQAFDELDDPEAEEFTRWRWPERSDDG